MSGLKPLTDSLVTETAAQDRTKPRLDVVLGGLTLGWLAAGAIAIVVGIIAISSETLTNRTLLAAVALAGAAGGCVSAVTAVTSYVGNRAFRASWTAYFFFRPLLGAAIGTIIYFLIRAGIVSTNAPADVLNRYGIVAISAFAGLYSKAVLDKTLQIANVFTARKSAFATPLALRQDPPRALRELTPYHGFIVHEMVPGSESTWLLRIWLQPKGDPDKRSQELRVGEGPASNTVRFRFTVFQHDYHSVTPQSGNIEVSSKEGRTKQLVFEFSGSENAGHPPTALVEISQHGRAVAVVSTYDPYS